MAARLSTSTFIFPATNVGVRRFIPAVSTQVPPSTSMRAFVRLFTTYHTVSLTSLPRSGQPESHHNQRCRSFTPLIHTRRSSHSPLGAAPPMARKKVTLQTLHSLYKRNEPITMITAHDFPSAHVADHAGMDMVLVGDSLAMVALGMEDTSEVVMEEMLLHCRSVSRGAKSAFIVSLSRSVLKA